MSQDWNIKPRSLMCEGTERPFAEGESYWSGLRFDEEGYSRHDYSSEYWDAEAGALAWVSTWKGVYEPPPAKASPGLTREVVEELLREMIESTDGGQTNVIYLLAVMLERKKIVIERELRKRIGGEKIRVYEHRKTGETFLVRDPELRLDELEEVRAEIIQLLTEREEADEAATQAAAEAEAAAAAKPAADESEGDAPSESEADADAPNI